MMRGEWLIRLGKALLHEDTFELMVAPAIADLQVDGTTAAYVAVWYSLTCAWWTDFDGDVRLVFDDAGMLGGLVAIQASYYSGMLLLLAAGMSARDAIIAVLSGDSPQFVAALSLILIASTVPTLLCFWPPRRELSPDS
jgi:hypothetical protein